MAKVRVLITDDSAAARAIIRDLLETGGIEVVGEAANGLEAVALAKTLRPSLITMDLEMPQMDGFAAIRQIMSEMAIPILVVSSQADAEKGFRAISSGALEVIAKPDISDGKQFCDKVEKLSEVLVIRHIRQHQKPLANCAAEPRPTPIAVTDKPTTRDKIATQVTALGTSRPVFVIACSTGGPQALETILKELPAEFAHPVIIAQHIAKGFAEGMVNWLQALCKIPVRLATDREPVLPGVIYIAPPEYRVAVNAQRQIALTGDNAKDIYHPSCDHLLNSCAAHYGNRVVGIILTGMGRDGVEGMRHIQLAGGDTIAQDEASSVIYGMNRLAIEAGVVKEILPLNMIARAIIRRSLRST
ncbi:MAG: chemotaxis-specific protein-glutamate methyltransferase CheB [Gammaproteobacteria bacterium]|nr:chemotaxis-specific protein-glutamate methyltransferase CheB [Gammaproteobacteria bacterium]